MDASFAAAKVGRKQRFFFSRYCPDETIVIEKCDECRLFENDFQAAQEAAKHDLPTVPNKHGFNIRISNAF